MNDLLFDSITKYKVWNLTNGFENLEQFLEGISNNKDVVLETKSGPTLAFERVLEENLVKSMFLIQQYSMKYFTLLFISRFHKK